MFETTNQYNIIMNYWQKKHLTTNVWNRDVIYKFITLPSINYIHNIYIYIYINKTVPLAIGFCFYLIYRSKCFGSDGWTPKVFTIPWHNFHAWRRVSWSDGPFQNKDGWENIFTKLLQSQPQNIRRYRRNLITSDICINDIKWQFSEGLCSRIAAL